MSDAERSRGLFVGDNLEGLARLEPGSVSLAYLDPPFNSGRVFDARVAKQQPKARAAFEDVWRWDEGATQNLKIARETCSKPTLNLLDALTRSLGESGMTSYLAMMAPRIEMLRRSMSESASMFLHVDPSASHYLKILLDSVFGADNFRNEIVWKRTHAHSGSRRFGPVHDVILFYTASRNYIWNQQFTPYSDEYLDKYFRAEDENGRYQLITCTAPGARPGTKAHYEWNGVYPPRDRHWAWTKDKMEEFDRQGRLVHSARSGIPRFKRYTSDGEGVRLQDIWLDINPLGAHSQERTGFETQKPLALLERIISSSTDPGDLVADAFGGSGTTAVAAERLGRSWWLADQTLLAASLSLARVRQEVPSSPIRLDGFVGSEAEAKNLRTTAPDVFAVWAASMLGTLLERDTMTATMAMGSRLAAPSVQSWIELAPGSERDLVRFTPESDRVHALVGATPAAEQIADWLTSRTGSAPSVVPLKSLTAGHAQRYGGVRRLIAA